MIIGEVVIHRRYSDRLSKDRGVLGEDEAFLDKPFSLDGLREGPRSHRIRHAWDRPEKATHLRCCDGVPATALAGKYVGDARRARRRVPTARAVAARLPDGAIPGPP